MMMVLLKNLTSNISVENTKRSQNGSKCKIEPFFYFYILHFNFAKNKTRLNRLKMEFKRSYILCENKIV